MFIAPVYALQFFLLFTLLPVNVNHFTMFSNDFGLQEWKRDGASWVAEDKNGKEIFRVTKAGNEIKTTTSLKLLPEEINCKDAAACFSTSSTNKENDGFFFKVNGDLGSDVIVKTNNGGLVFFQEKGRFIYRHPVIVLYGDDTH